MGPLVGTLLKGPSFLLRDSNCFRIVIAVNLSLASNSVRRSDMHVHIRGYSDAGPSQGNRDNIYIYILYIYTRLRKNVHRVLRTFLLKAPAVENVRKTLTTDQKKTFTKRSIRAFHHKWHSKTKQQNKP